MKCEIEAKLAIAGGSSTFPRHANSTRRTEVANKLRLAPFFLAAQKLESKSDKEQERGKECVAVELRAAWED